MTSEWEWIDIKIIVTCARCPRLQGVFYPSVFVIIYGMNVCGTNW